MAAEAEGGLLLRGTEIFKKFTTYMRFAHPHMLSLQVLSFSAAQLWFTAAESIGLAVGPGQERNCSPCPVARVKLRSRRGRRLFGSCVAISKVMGCYNTPEGLLGRAVPAAL